MEMLTCTRCKQAATPEFFPPHNKSLRAWDC